MALIPVIPFAPWASGTNQNSIPSNDNSIRWRLLSGNIKSAGGVTAQPGSPTDGDAYILGATHTGAQWAGFSQNDLVIFHGTPTGTWYAFGAVKGIVVSVEGTLWTFDGTNWLVAAGRAPNVQNVASASSITPTFSNDTVKVTALAANLTINAPTGTAIDMAGLVIRIKDNGTSRTLTWNSIFRAVGVTLPAATTINKTLYVGAIYNTEDTKWDVTAVALES